MTKNFSVEKIGKITSIRTGLVLSRKEAQQSDYLYQIINLKNITENGQISAADYEKYYSNEIIKKEYLTHNNDILLRLSSPYTAVIINEKEAGLLIPSHFAIIRSGKTLDPHYLHWWLTKARKQFYKIASGGTMMGTISTGYVQEMLIELLPIEHQQKIGELHNLAMHEQYLLSLLADKKKQLKLQIDIALMKSIKGDNSSQLKL